MKQDVCHKAQSTVLVVDDLFGYKAAGHQGNLHILYQPISGQPGVSQSLTQRDSDRLAQFPAQFDFLLYVLEAF